MTGLMCLVVAVLQFWICNDRSLTIASFAYTMQKLSFCLQWALAFYVMVVLDLSSPDIDWSHLLVVLFSLHTGSSFCAALMQESQQHSAFKVPV